ncbi:sulfite exporter TauE/SafE family protein [Tenacibaculum finnmarkense]|uniref:sulfite exporter TauE/SafE family protein n=1 Tax=Tenacibaculum finnmarkense TaxID=2781243 RepID=UPI001EFAFEE4|nr:sulfite exporter TauE/SafE family protein [Tenacibaculum finnmarkense]MCG8732491.1 sulfite exporter TauE/SafE family protein [Tenacibaculum finnmarkense]
MFLSALIFGLLGSFHCIGMCGPIAFMLPVDRTNKITQFFQILSYHFGRLFTYSLIGLLFGFLGKGFYFFGFQQQLSIAAGILMILVILLPKTFQKYNFSKPINKWVMKVKSSLGKELKNKGNDTFFTIGFLNGFLPCGLVYMAVFGALASSNALSGSLYMFLFGLGTVPLMTIIVYVGNFASGLLRKTIQQAIPYVVVFIGILFILRGLGLGIPYVSPLPVSNLTAPIQGCH